MITINGKKYAVVEDLGYVHSRGAYAKVIDFDGEEKVVIKIDRKWRIAEPLIEPGGRYKGQGNSKSSS